MKSRPLVALALAASVVLAGAAAASADPVPSSPGTPPAGWDATDIYAGVGADAFAELTNEVAKQYNGNRTPGNGKYLASYDAVNPQTAAAGEPIVTKPGCDNNLAVVRPNGANAGIAAIKGNTQNADGDYCIDFVRSSAAKTGADAALTFYAQSRDAVGYATVGNAYAPTAPLTAAQLKSIFLCETTDWSEVGGQAGAVHVYLPPASAATLTFFLKAIGITGGMTDVKVGCGDPDGPNPTTYKQQQNDGRTLDGDPQGIAPYAVTKWAAQLNEAPGINDNRGGSHLGYVNTVVEPLTQTTLGNKTYSVLNPAFSSANANFSRLFFNVVRNDAPQTLKDIFIPGGFVCSNANNLLIPFGNTPLGNDTNASAYCGQAY